MIICLEGSDGSGKTSVAESLGIALGAKVIHFPNDDTVTGPMIRSYLAKKWWVSEPMMVGDHQVQSESLANDDLSGNCWCTVIVSL